MDSPSGPAPPYEREGMPSGTAKKERRIGMEAPGPAQPHGRHLSYLGRQRARQDDRAHAEDDGSSRLVIPDDPLIPRGDPEWIDEPDGLRRFIDEARGLGALAYDSEFIGERSYFHRVCVIQAATVRRVALVDPLSPRLDLRPFWELLADASVEKIVQAGVQDLEPVHRFLGQAPANVFDVQIAAGFAGLPYPLSLAKLVGEFLGLELGKGLKFSQWDRRPLTAIQLRYAANDVRFLPVIRARLGDRLRETGNEAWSAEECGTLAEPSLYDFDPDQQCLRVRGWDRLDSGGLARLRALVIWRDALARRSDVPPRALVADRLLISLSRDPTETAADLVRAGSLPRSLEPHGPEIIRICREATDRPGRGPRFRRHRGLGASDVARVDALWAEAQDRCRERRVDPALFSSRKEIARTWWTLTRGEPGDGTRLTRGWRKGLLGGAIENAAAEALKERRSRRRSRG